MFLGTSFRCKNYILLGYFPKPYKNTYYYTSFFNLLVHVFASTIKAVRKIH